MAYEITPDVPAVCPRDHQASSSRDTGPGSKRPTLSGAISSSGKRFHFLMAYFPRRIS